jgi:hypothetical protein
MAEYQDDILAEQNAIKLMRPSVAAHKPRLKVVADI